MSTVLGQNHLAIICLKRRKECIVQKIIEEYEDFFGRELGTFPAAIHLETEDDASPLIIPKTKGARWAEIKAETRIRQICETCSTCPNRRANPLC